MEYGVYSRKVMGYFFNTCMEYELCAIYTVVIKLLPPSRTRNMNPLWKDAWNSHSQMVGCCMFYYSVPENLFDTLSCLIPPSVSLSLSYSCTVDWGSSSQPTPFWKCPLQLWLLEWLYCRYSCCRYDWQCSTSRLWTKTISVTHLGVAAVR